MEHIVQFAVGIDDDRITEEISKHALNQITQDLKRQVTNKVFRSSYYNDNADAKRDPLIDFSRSVISEALLKDREEIINKAAAYMAEKFLKSKSGREMLKTMIMEGNDG